ncbi:hypothetical protein BDZ91DRAFT_853294 [Kalaharituber pfeilii]|nr:hypothetical protein BDZ91DRAFT_853294 [Kalaharituber pfeilii]
MGNVNSTHVFDPLILESRFVKITVVEGSPRPRIANTGASSREFLASNCNIGAQNSVFYVHKDLLASKSPELFKHLNINMDEITLRGIERQTIQSFLEWAYRGCYVLREDVKQIKHAELETVKEMASPRALLENTKLYIFAHRFQITALQHLSIRYIESSDLPGLKLKEGHQYNAVHLLRAVNYAVDNLPKSGDRLLTCYIKMLAWASDRIASLPEFSELIQAHPEIAVGICKLGNKSNVPPWSDRLEPAESPQGKHQPWLTKTATDNFSMVSSGSSSSFCRIS